MSEPRRLRVATFNIRNGLGTELEHCWFRRRRVLLEAVRGLAADVLGLQEAYWFQLRWLLRQLGPEWEAVGAGRTDGRHKGEQCPILANRTRARIQEPRTRWYSPEPDTAGSKLADASFPRVATTAVVSIDGADVTVVNTHLDERHPANRSASVDLLLEWATEWPGPAVLMGDFNAPLEADELAALVGAGWHPALPAGAGGTSHEYTGGTDGAQIDHILVSPEWRVVSARVDTTRPRGRLPSDHWPVVADLELLER